jgi:hypothetical protein
MIGKLVDRMATPMSINNGMAAILVRKPTRITAPKTISTTPTNGPVRCGAGIMGIFSKRPAACSAG